MSAESSRFLWDAHACPSLEVGCDLSPLLTYLKCGYHFVSINAGFDPQSLEQVLELIAYYTAFIDQTPDLILAKSVNDVLKAKKNNQLAISFDIEGLGPFKNNLSTLSQVKDLGVKQIGIAYNKPNQAGGGCQEEDLGLSSLGHEFVIELNNLGLIIDCSHVGEITAKDVIAYSSSPVVFSHSNPSSLNPHHRNISDAIIRMCADKGGVIGLNGINLFLKNKSISIDNFIDHLDYLIQLAGEDHIGLGFDYVFDFEETLQLVKKYPENFENPEQYLNVEILSPFVINEIISGLRFRNYASSVIDKILGKNFLRVASEVWK